MLCGQFASAGNLTEAGGAYLVALVDGALVATVKVLAPGVRGVAGVLLAGPVPGRLECVLEVGVEQYGLLPGWQVGADGCGPCDGLVPRKAGFWLLGDEDQAMCGWPVALSMTMPV